MRGREATRFFGSVGHSNLATYSQDGKKVKNPVFPFSMRFEATEEIKYEDRTYEETFHE